MRNPVTIGVIVFVVVAVPIFLFVYPWVFGLISGLFGNSDLGALAAIAVLFFSTGAVLWLAALVAILVASLFGKP